MAGALRNIWALACALALAGCVLSGGGSKPPAGPNPVTGGEITVTALDDLPPAAAAAAAPGPAMTAPAMTGPAVTGPAVAGPAAAAAETSAAAPGSAAPEAATAEAATPGAGMPAAAPEVPAEQKSAARLACEKRKGVWARAGNGSHSCVSYTRDGGKTCRKAGDCESECLARSGTCAPLTPLLGCNDILDDSGRRMTLCLD